MISNSMSLKDIALHSTLNSVVAAHLNSSRIPLWLSLPSLSIPKCTVHIPAVTMRGPGLKGRGTRGFVRWCIDTSAVARDTTSNDAHALIFVFGARGVDMKASVDEVNLGNSKAGISISICAINTLRTRFLRSADSWRRNGSVDSQI